MLGTRWFWRQLERRPERIASRIKWSLSPFLFILALLGSLGPIGPASATTTTAVNGETCAGDRDRQSLTCTAGEFTPIVNITNAPGSPTSCVAGDYVTLIGSVGLSGTNADRYNVGFFTGENGNDPRIVGTGETCSVATFPTSPLPWFAKNADACGDYKAGGVDSPIINNIKVLCAGDAAGQLMVPYTLVYSQTRYNCTGPGNVKSGSRSKCNAGTAVVDTATFTVNGSVTVTKQTVPDGDAQSFSFTASGTGPVMSGDGSFSLADNGSKRVRMGISGTDRTLTITEAATALWELTATIACTKPDGSSAAGFVATDGATRTITATLSNTNPNAVCTITNRRAVSATNSTVVANPTSVVNDGVSTSTITVTLKDTSVTGNPVAGKTVTLTAGSGSSTITTLNGVTDVNGQATFTVKDTVAESVTYTATDTTDGITLSQTATVTFYVPVSDFNAFETSTAAGAIAGVIKTKVAGSSFGLDVVAISGGSQSSAFSNSVKVELLGNTTTGIGLDANNCPTSYTVLQTVSPAPTISGGRSTVSFAAVSNAWKDVRVRISYPTSSPTVVSCSTDNFAIRPNALAAYAAHADWETAGTSETLDNAGATGTPIHKAGRNFTLVATGYNAASVVTSNYDGTPTATSVAAVAPASIAGNFLVGTFTAGGGTVRSDTATYDEVGPVSLILQDQDFASVDAADTAGDCSATGRYVCSAAFTVGRFVPDHFLVTPGTLTNRRLLGCSPASGFTYAGEQLRVQFTLTARNGLAAPAVTQNYTSASGLAKLAGGVPANFSFGAVDLADATPPTGATALTGSLGLVASSGSWIAGAGSFTVDLGLNRSATPDGPYESFRLGIVPADTDGVTLRTADLNLDTTVPADSNDRVLVGSSIVRFGRLRLANAHGSELLDLPIPISVQYWNGTLFVTNTADSCTSLSSSSIGLGNYKKNLNSGETSVSPATISFASGVGSLKLTKPGAGNSGSVDLCVDLGADPVGGTTCSATSASLSYLQGKWPPGTAWDNDPTARASFGVYKNANEFIYLREMY